MIANLSLSIWTFKVQYSNILPVVSVGISGRLFPALIGFWVQKTVISVYWVAEVVPVLLLPFRKKNIQFSNNTKIQNSISVHTSII